MPKFEDTPQYAAAAKAQATLDALIAEAQAAEEPDRKKAPEFEAALNEAAAAITGLQELRKKKGKPTPTEETLAKTSEDALAEQTKVQAAAKAAKDAARKALQAEVAKAASPYLGNKDDLKKIMDEAEECGVPDKELNDPREKLTAMVSFHFQLEEAAKLLNEAATGRALTIETTKLEAAISEVNEGALNELKKIELLLWLETLTKPSATNIATDALDEAVNLAKAMEIDDKIWKPKQKKSAEAKKAQNAKKIADRKAKKPPADPPKEPDRQEPDEIVGQLKTALLEAMATAEAKLNEAKTTIAMEAAAKPNLLTTEILLDLGDRPVEEAHPAIQALEDALKAAKENKAEQELLEKAEEALKTAKEARTSARTSLARSKLVDAASPDPSVCDVKILTEAIKVAKEESVDEGALAECEAKLALSYKVQSENSLEPLAQPQPLSHEGFQIIDPLKAAIDEAKKRGALEDLQIKAEAKLTFWLEARARRDKAIKAMDASLKPPPCNVEQPLVEENLVEASESKVDPELQKAAARKLEIARLAQQLYDKSKKNPGSIEIGVLEEELVSNGGEDLQIEEERLAKCEATSEELKTKIEAIKETKASQKARDDLLKKQIKKQGKLNVKPEDGSASDLLLPAWVRKEEVGEAEVLHETADAVNVQQGRELEDLEARLKEAEAVRKEQAEVVKKMLAEMLVPKDVVKYAQLKLSVTRDCDVMQQQQLPPLLEIDGPALEKQIKKCEFKYPEMTIAGLGELDCNVPKDELDKARVRLRDALKAQARQAKARSQLQVRTNAPTGTATFDMLVKLVAEGKQAGVEEEYIVRAERKLKKMEELAASSLRAGPLAFISFHCPCLRACVSSYAISLVEKAEEKRREDYEKSEKAKTALVTEIGGWERGVFDRSLIAVPTSEERLAEALQNAVACGLPQEVIEIARLKLAAIAKYKSDMAKGLIKDEDEEKKKAEAEAKKGGEGKAPKKKMKQYAFQKKQ